MKSIEAVKVQNALDTISVALADHNHKWTKEERKHYYSAIRILSKYVLDNQDV